MPKATNAFNTIRAGLLACAVASACTAKEARAQSYLLVAMPYEYTPSGPGVIQSFVNVVPPLVKALATSSACTAAFNNYYSVGQGLGANRNAGGCWPIAAKTVQAGSTMILYQNNGGSTSAGYVNLQLPIVSAADCANYLATVESSLIQLWATRSNGVLPAGVTQAGTCI